MKLKQFIITAVTLALSASSKGQISINNNAPQATLDITAGTTDGSAPEGLIPPRLTGNQIKSSDNQYGSAQKGVIIYATAAVTTASAKTANISDEGYYYFDGSVWQKINNGNDYASASPFSYGDIKVGTQSVDHNGWVLLNGRSVNTLTAAQQSRALALGLSFNIPDASNAYLVQNGQTLGSITGSNTRTIAQNQLPNIFPSISISAISAGTPTGSVNINNTTETMQSSGAHSHSIGRRSNSDNNSYDTGNGRQTENSAMTTDRQYLTTFSTSSFGHTHTVNAHTHTASFTGNAMTPHSHTVSLGSINGGVAQQVLDITPQSMSFNMFIYLGN